MTAPPRTLQERLRVPVYMHSDPGFTNAERREAAAALDAKNQLLAEAGEALEPFAEIASELVDGLRDDKKNTRAWAVPKVGELRKARAVLAKLKGASP